MTVVKLVLPLLLGSILGGAIVTVYTRYQSILPCDILTVEAVAASRRAIDKETIRHPAISQLKLLAGPFVRMAIRSKIKEKRWSQADCVRVGYRWLTEKESDLVGELFPEIKSLKGFGKSLKRLEKSLRGLRELPRSERLGMLPTSAAHISQNGPFFLSFTRPSPR